jgi:hypothetical protein
MPGMRLEMGGLVWELPVGAVVSNDIGIVATKGVGQCI